MTMNRFDELYEVAGADKAYYLACAFDVSHDRAQFWAACRMYAACQGLELGSYIGGYVFPEDDSDGISEATYHAWREEAGMFREYMESHPSLMAWRHT
jgi:hypothetical protein